MMKETLEKLLKEHYYKTSLSDKQKLQDAPITEIGAEFNIYIYKKTQKEIQDK